METVFLVFGKTCPGSEPSSTTGQSSCMCKRCKLYRKKKKRGGARGRGIRQTPTDGTGGQEPKVFLGGRPAKLPSTELQACFRPLGSVCTLLTVLLWVSSKQEMAPVDFHHVTVTWGRTTSLRNSPCPFIYDQLRALWPALSDMLTQRVIAALRRETLDIQNKKEGFKWNTSVLRSSLQNCYFLYSLMWYTNRVSHIITQYHTWTKLGYIIIMYDLETMHYY